MALQSSLAGCNNTAFDIDKATLRVHRLDRQLIEAAIVDAKEVRVTKINHLLA